MGHDLPELLKKLAGAEVDFVLVGGFAAVAHGCTLVTRDVDVVIAMDPGSLLKLWSALATVNPRFKGSDPPRTFTERDAGTPGWKNLYLETDLGPVDCLGEVKAIGDYSQCLARSVEWDLEGSAIHILDREALIESKLAIGRERDRQAAIQLEILGGLSEGGSPDGQMR